MSLIFSRTLQNLSLALTKTTQRQSMLLANIANANVPGYKRKDMDFNIQLDGISKGAPLRFKRHSKEMGLSAEGGTTLRPDGNNVDLEREVFSMAETELRYSILTELTQKEFKDIQRVIRDGK